MFLNLKIKLINNFQLYFYKKKGMIMHEMFN